jgi:nucleotide-binding universal stress UspA family protein
MKAFEYAIQLAQAVNAKVFVVHVVQNPAMTVDALVSVSELKTSFKKQGSKLLSTCQIEEKQEEETGEMTRNQVQNCKFHNKHYEGI